MCSGTAFQNLVKRDQRFEVDVPATAIRDDGTSLDVTLRNMSYNGCMLFADAALAIGDKVILAIPGMGEIKAQVRWASNEGRTGARFVLEQINAGDRRHLRQL